MPLKRITITIPETLLRAADERAQALDRSRSWVVVDALRRSLEEAGPGPKQGEGTYRAEPPAAFVAERQAEPAAPATQRVAEPANATRTHAARLGPYRRAQLEADLRLPIEQRVREAELAARVTELRTTPLRSHRVLTFDRYEDYLEWERWEERAR